MLVLFLAAISGENFIDPDVFHQLALIRETMALGHIPLEDRFAYTPTVSPSIHHEWGSGMVLMMVTETLGGSGILVLKYALALALAALIWCTARRRGAPVAVLLALLPLGALLVATGFSTLRAQVYSLLLTPMLLFALEFDRRGDRRWVLPWLAVHVLWVNLHAGFVVGLLLLALHTAETFARRRPAKHLVFVLAAMCVLILANPYGWKYPSAIAHGLAFDRSLVTEWDPIWRESPTIQAVFGFSILTVVYALGRSGWRNLEGLSLVAATSLAAMQHQRHLSIHAVVWCALAPAWIAGTPIGAAFDDTWKKRSRVCAAAATIVLLVGIWSLVRERPWRLRVPANPGDHESLVYPAGAVDYLVQIRFRGNVMTPFTVGAYVSWRLHPHVKVSFDSRYEAAYPPEAAPENRDFYAAREGWRAILDRYPTDLVLAPAGSKVALEFAQVSPWTRVYADDGYVLLARPGLVLPQLDRRGQELRATFP